MANDACDVHELYSRLEEQLGTQTTDLPMSRLPLTPADELLTKDEFRAEMSLLRAEMREEMADPRQDLTRLSLALGIGTPLATAGLVAAVVAVA